MWTLAAMMDSVVQELDPQHLTNRWPRSIKESDRSIQVVVAQERDPQGSGRSIVPRLADPKRGEVDPLDGRLAELGRVGRLEQSTPVALMGEKERRHDPGIHLPARPWLVQAETEGDRGKPTGLWRPVARLRKTCWTAAPSLAGPFGCAPHEGTTPW